MLRRQAVSTGQDSLNGPRQDKGKGLANVDLDHLETNLVDVSISIDKFNEPKKNKVAKWTRIKRPINQEKEEVLGSK